MLDLIALLFLISLYLLVGIVIFSFIAAFIAVVASSDDVQVVKKK